MSKQPYMPVKVPDFIADTVGMSAAEVGCYWRLCMALWQKHAEPLPDDDARMARTCGVSLSEWLAIKPVLLPYFSSDPSGWTHHRVTEAWVESTNRRVKASANGAKGGKAKALKNNKPTLATATNPLDDPLQQPVKRNGSNGGSGSVANININDSVDISSDISTDAPRASHGPPEDDLFPGTTPPPVAQQAAAADPLDLKTIIFGKGLHWLAQRSNRSESTLRSMIGRWIRDHGEAMTMQAFIQAQGANPFDALSWINKFLGARGNGKKSDSVAITRQDRESILHAFAQDLDSGSGGAPARGLQDATAGD